MNRHNIGSIFPVSGTHPDLISSDCSPFSFFMRNRGSLFLISFPSLYHLTLASGLSVLHLSFSLRLVLPAFFFSSFFSKPNSGSGAARNRPMASLLMRLCMRTLCITRSKVHGDQYKVEKAHFGLKVDVLWAHLEADSRPFYMLMSQVLSRLTCPKVPSSPKPRPDLLQWS